jgi:hypothetical protein
VGNEVWMRLNLIWWTGKLNLSSAELWKTVGNLNHFMRAAQQSSSPFPNQLKLLKSFNYSPDISEGIITEHLIARYE